MEYYPPYITFFAEAIAHTVLIALARTRCLYLGHSLLSPLGTRNVWAACSMEPPGGTDPERDTQSQPPTTRSADKSKKRPTNKPSAAPTVSSHLPSPDLRTFPTLSDNILSPLRIISQLFPVFQLLALLSSRTRAKNHKDLLLRGVPLNHVRSLFILFRPPNFQS